MIKAFSPWLWALVIIVTSHSHGDAVKWLDSKASDSIAYFLMESSPRIEVYDLKVKSWKPAITLKQIPTAFHVDKSNLYVAYDKAVYRYSKSGGEEKHLGNLNYRITSIFTDGDFVFVFTNVDLKVIHRSSAVLIGESTTNRLYLSQGVSHNSDQNIFYGCSSGLSPSDIGFMTYDSTGKINKSKDSPYHGAFKSASKTWVYKFGTKVVDNTGNIYNGTTLEYLGSLVTSVKDLVIYGQNTPIVLNDSQLIAYSSGYLETGTKSVSNQVHSLYVTGDSLALFSVNQTSPNGMAVEFHGLNSFISGKPGEPVFPENLKFIPDEVMLGKNVLYLYSKKHSSIFRWEYKNQKWIRTVPLLGSPDYVSYSEINTAVYTAYRDGRIMKIDVSDTGFIEKPFVNLPIACMGIVSAGEFLVTSDQSGNWGTTRVFSVSGEQISTLDWSHPLYNAAWSEKNRKIYQFENGSLPNDLFSSELGIDGLIKKQMNSPYNSGGGINYPIRVKPDGTIVVLGSGRIYDANSLTQINTLSDQIRDATWINGELYTLDSLNVFKWNLPTYAKGNKMSIEGEGIRLLTTQENKLMLVYMDKCGFPQVGIYDTAYVNLLPSNASGTNTCKIDNSSESIYHVAIGQPEMMKDVEVRNIRGTLIYQGAYQNFLVRYRNSRGVFLVRESAMGKLEKVETHRVVMGVK
jgi:hypothetical protein